MAETELAALLMTQKKKIFGSGKVTGIDSNSIVGVWFQSVWKHGCLRVTQKKRKTQNLSHNISFSRPATSPMLSVGWSVEWVEPPKPNDGDILEAS